MISMTRRTFFTGLTAAIDGLLQGLFGKTKSSPRITANNEEFEEDEGQPKIKSYNQLDQTGITVSDIAFGAGVMNMPGVIRHAFDLGINLFDTVSLYGWGVSEDVIGED